MESTDPRLWYLNLTAGLIILTYSIRNTLSLLSQQKAEEDDDSDSHQEIELITRFACIANNIHQAMSGPILIVDKVLSMIELVVALGPGKWKRKAEKYRLVELGLDLVTAGTMLVFLWEIGEMLYFGSWSGLSWTLVGCSIISNIQVM